MRRLNNQLIGIHRSDFEGANKRLLFLEIFKLGFAVITRLIELVEQIKFSALFHIVQTQIESCLLIFDTRLMLHHGQPRNFAANTQTLFKL